MKEDSSQSLFGVVALNIAEFRLQVEGESGEKIRNMGKAQGAIPDLIRGVVNAMADTLSWLYRTSVAAESHVIAADAAIASLEVLADAIEALGEGLEFGNTSQMLGLPAEPFEKIGSAITDGSDVMKTGLEIASLLPRPEDLRRIRDELEASLGTRVNTELEIPGVLTQLVQDISVVENS